MKTFVGSLRFFNREEEGKMGVESEVYYAIKSARSEGKDLKDFLEIVRENWKLVLDEEREQVDSSFKD